MTGLFFVVTELIPIFSKKELFTWLILLVFIIIIIILKLKISQFKY